MRKQITSAPKQAKTEPNHMGGPHAPIDPSMGGL